MARFGYASMCIDAGWPGRLRTLEGRLPLKQLRAILLSILYSACAFLSEVLVAIRLLLGEHERRLRLLNLSLARVDLGPLHGNLRINILNAGLGSSDLCARLCKRDAVVAIINAGDHASCGNVLVVGDRYLTHVARHFRSNGDLARCDDGIVGRLEMPSVAPIDAAGPSRQREEDRANRNRNWVTAPETLARLSAARAGWRGLFVCLGGQFRTLWHAGRALLTRPSLRFRLLFPGRTMCERIVRWPIRRAWNELRAINFLQRLLVIAVQHDT